MEVQAYEIVRGMEVLISNRRTVKATKVERVGKDIIVHHADGTKTFKWYKTVVVLPPSDEDDEF